METTSVEKEEDPIEELITDAHDEFVSGNYNKCLEKLDKLEKIQERNIILRHNRAVAKFFHSTCLDHEVYLKTLFELNEEDSNESHNIIRYNMAIVYYHRQFFEKCYDTLLLILKEIKRLDEITALSIILMIRLLVDTKQFNKLRIFFKCIFKRMGTTNIQDLHKIEDVALPSQLASISGYSRIFKKLLYQMLIFNRQNIVISDDSAVELIALKAHQFYIMKDFQMASKQLQRIKEEFVVNNYETNTCIANNMGVIHLRVRHYALAAQFFQTALNFDKPLSVNFRTLPLHKMSSPRACEILYNLGISMLHLRRPVEAFQYLLIPVKRYHNNPRLWFRIAEACIMHNQMQMAAEDKNPGQRARQPIQNNSHDINHMEPNLKFALVCLRNALALTQCYANKMYDPPEENQASGSSTDTEETDWASAKDNNFCQPSIPIDRNGLEQIQACICAAYSYVNLRLGDYVGALEMSQKLLDINNISDVHKLLARMYAGEALAMLDRFTDANPQFDPSYARDLNEYDFETKDWEVKSLDAAQNICRYNLAIAMYYQDDIPRAISLLNNCTHEIVANKTKAFRRFLSERRWK